MGHFISRGRIVLSGCLIVNDKHEILLLHRKDHGHYETPGGKVRLDECSNPESPSIDDLRKTAKREVHEELGSDVRLAKLSYFGKVKFTVPDGRLAIANKFITMIVSGKPIVNEPEIFSEMKFIPIDELEKELLSPDLRLFLDKLKSFQAKLLNKQ